MSSFIIFIFIKYYYNKQTKYVDWLENVVRIRKIRTTAKILVVKETISEI
jgi:hypothetical protein